MWGCDVGVLLCRHNLHGEWRLDRDSGIDYMMTDTIREGTARPERLDGNIREAFKIQPLHITHSSLFSILPVDGRVS